jgi:hypothetical protein
MMVSGPRAGLSAISTALFLAIIALPFSVVAFAALYANHDAFWAACWLWLVLPILWVAAAVLAIRDALKRRSSRQLIGVVALLVPMALLFTASGSNRFLFHQLFAFRRFELPPLPKPVGWYEKFTVCAEEASCMSHDAVTQTRTFRLDEVPKGCCVLKVINGNRGKHTVERFRVVLNGKEVKLIEVKLPKSFAVQIAEVDLSTENTIGVQLSGTPDAFVHVLISYTGKRNTPPE